MSGFAIDPNLVSPLAGHAVPKELIVDLARLEHEYYAAKPDVREPRMAVRYGTGGHRGSPLDRTFTEAHVLAIAQAICDFRRGNGIHGPPFPGKDTHALSEPAQRTTLEVLAANGVECYIQQNNGVTPTPAISRAIVCYNQSRKNQVSDGIVITPSHNPPEDGGLKYNTTNGGPASTLIARWIEDRANELLRTGNTKVNRIPFEQAVKASTTHREDFVMPYVWDLVNVLDMDAIGGAQLELAVDPLGGASRPYWDAISEIYGLRLLIVNPRIDPTFSFMTADHGGRIRMDCTSPYAMGRLLSLKDRYHLAFANDPDSDRFGIITPSDGLLKPDAYLAVTIGYLLTHRPDWLQDVKVGKTVVNSSMIDAVVAKFGRRLCEMPVGFNWFARALFERSLCFAGGESAGAAFLRRNGAPWTTDKDGIVMNLLGAEIAARTGNDPARLYRQFTAEFGTPHYARIDAPATPEQKQRLENLPAEAVRASRLGGEVITAKFSHAPGNDYPIAGLKVIAPSGWFAARPSGTSELYRIYAESFCDGAHLETIITEARQIVAEAIS